MTKKKNGKLLSRFLTIVEKGGNALPHPATLFGLLAVLVLVASAIASAVDWSGLHPKSQQIITAENLLTVEWLHKILLHLVDNFTAFAPFGIVLVAMLGIGVAESSGLISALIRMLVLSAPKRLLTFVVVFTGILSNVASDVGYVLLIPLAGAIFISVGRHPIIGLAAAFAGVSGGFSANLLLGTVDPLLAGLSTEAAKAYDPMYIVNPTANYYFMVVSTFIISFAGTWITEKIVAPRYKEYHSNEEDSKIERLNKKEKRGLLYSGILTLLFTAVIVAGITPKSGFLRGHYYQLNENTFTELKADVPDIVLDKAIKIEDELYTKQSKIEIALEDAIGCEHYKQYGETIIEKSQLDVGGILNSPVIRGVIAILFLFAGLAGLAYGIGAGTFKNDADVMKGMSTSMKSLSTYIVLVFFAAQFIKYFEWSNLGALIAIHGAEGLSSSHVPMWLVVVLFILFAAGINLLMGSASAKWALLAPVFVPMFMDYGFSPELTQVMYRIGDSTTNVISPMMSFFALIIAYFQKYEKNAGIGTVVATMLPYSIIFLIIWTILLIVWIQLGIPLGPGAPLLLE